MGASLWKTYVGSNSKFLWSVFKKGPESVGNIGNNNQGRRKFDYGRVLASLRLDVRELLASSMCSPYYSWFSLHCGRFSGSSDAP